MLTPFQCECGAHYLVPNGWTVWRCVCGRLWTELSKLPAMPRPA